MPGAGYPILFAFLAKRVGDQAILFAMEPSLITAPELNEILAELSRLRTHLSLACSTQNEAGPPLKR